MAVVGGGTLSDVLLFAFAFEPGVGGARGRPGGARDIFLGTRERQRIIFVLCIIYQEVGLCILITYEVDYSKAMCIQIINHNIGKSIEQTGQHILFPNHTSRNGL